MGMLKLLGLKGRRYIHITLFYFLSLFVLLYFPFPNLFSSFFLFERGKDDYSVVAIHLYYNWKEGECTSVLQGECTKCSHFIWHRTHDQEKLLGFGEYARASLLTSQSITGAPPWRCHHRRLRQPLMTKWPRWPPKRSPTTLFNSSCPDRWALWDPDKPQSALKVEVEAVGWELVREPSPTISLGCVRPKGGNPSWKVNNSEMCQSESRDWKRGDTAS